MEWLGRRQSDNVVDARGGGGMRTAGALGGGGIIIAIIYALLGGDPRVILDQTQPQSAPVASAPATPASASSDPQRAFVGVVLADTEDVWTKVFASMGRRYEDPKLVLFSGRVDTACGGASSAVGPFYCPRDRQVYLDLNFFTEMSNRLGAKGDFARAYVIAHEIGHHVQNLLGVEGQASAQRRGASESASNRVSVGLELQADCLAGVWAKQTDSAKHVLEPGDVEEAMGAAAAVGDDRLQQRSRGYVVPDSFTHGTSAQRVAAFSKGFDGGDLPACGITGVAH